MERFMYIRCKINYHLFACKLKWANSYNTLQHIMWIHCHGRLSSHGLNPEIRNALFTHIVDVNLFKH